ncbi:threonine/serine ThrE exporter family protein [Bradyrhizobium sp. PUT101]|uniref:threonine/serine ThrE exporter family protein n=1 Tax=Bradyrhizobium sp. PUT101 TaxID=3447427 RepID=UPI003F871999
MSEQSDRQSERREADPLSVIIRVAELLFVHGETTEGTRRTVERLGGGLGTRVIFVPRWGDLRILPDRCTFGAEVAAEPLGVDMARVNATELLVDKLCDHKTSPRAALSELDDIARLPAVELSRFVAMAAAGAAALSVIFGATDFLTVGWTALSAGIGAGARRLLSLVSRNPFVQPFAAALVAGAIVSLLSSAHLAISQHLVAACPCMVLVPGPHFLNGAIDLVRARIALGAARILFASLVIVAICAGLLIGLSFGPTRLDAPVTSVQVPFFYDLCAAGVAVAAYGAFFNMPWRMLPAPIAIGVSAHALRWLVLDAGASMQLGALAGCTLAGLSSALLSRRLRVPFGAIAFAAVVSLIPGIFMFQTAADALSIISSGPGIPGSDLYEIASNVVKVSVTLLAMATGLIVPKMLLDGWLLLSRNGDRRHGAHS